MEANKVNVLLIDDDKVLSKTTSLRLQKRGYNVEVCNSAKEGLKMSLEGKFDILLLDIKMPEMSGVEVLTEIRAKKEKNLFPIIMVSSNEEQDDIVEALNLGANDYITKPINIDVLVARIVTQIDIRRLSIEFASKKEIEAVGAMIATYNHEINNPLAIAFGTLDALERKNQIPKEDFQKLEESLDRINNIVKKIGKISEKGKVLFEDYTENSVMLKIDED
jgi:DNA-binding response OmpR family regulator